MVWKAIADFQQCRRNNQCYPNPEKPLAKGVSWGHPGFCGLRRAAEQIHRLAEEKSWTENVWHGRISAPKNESKLQKKNTGEGAFSITCLALTSWNCQKSNVQCTRLKCYRGNLSSEGMGKLLWGSQNLLLASGMGKSDPETLLLFTLHGRILVVFWVSWVSCSPVIELTAQSTLQESRQQRRSGMETLSIENTPANLEYRNGAALQPVQHR